MRRRQVRFVGNCQASAMANLYRDFIGRPAHEDVIFVDDLGMDTDAIRRAITGADVAIVQERDFKHGLTREQLGGTIEVHTFPLILAGFLFPFANEPHVLNVSERPISDGPYPSQMGDSYLNRLIKKGVSPEDALDQYRSLDIARHASLDRLMEIYLDRQRERDKATGFSLAGAIEDGFRTERMFLTAEHPDARLFGLCARQLFEKMDAPAAAIDLAIGCTVRSPFPPTELPLHPGVIAHFGLSYADDETRYTFLDEGRFTFDEYVLRYMRYQHNPDLRRAIYMVDREDPAITLERLERGLSLSPGSAGGRSAQGYLLGRLGRHDEAVSSHRAAIVLDPDAVDRRLDLARALMQVGGHEEAERIASAEIAQVPTLAEAHMALASALLARNAVPSALEAAHRALSLAPGKPQTYRGLGIALMTAGEAAEAERIARIGMLMEPGDPNHRNLVAEILEALGRRNEAVTLLDEGLAIDVFNDQTFSLLGNFHMRDGALEKAGKAFGRGAEMFGAGRPDLAACYRQVQDLLAA